MDDEKDTQRIILAAELLQNAKKPVHQRDLAKQLDCSIFTANATVKALKLIGLVTTETGEGTTWAGPDRFDIEGFITSIRQAVRDAK